MLFQNHGRTLKARVPKAFLGAILLALFYYLLFRWFGIDKSYLDRFTQLRTLDLAFLLLAYLAFLFSNGAVLKALMESFGVHLKFREWFWLGPPTILGSQIIPYGGIGVRAQYFKTYYHFPYTDFLKASVLLFQCQFLIFSLLGALGWLTQAKTGNGWIFLFFIATFICFLSLRQWLPNLFPGLETDFASIPPLSKRLFLEMALFYLVQLFLNFAIFRSLQVPVSLTGLAVISAVAGLSMLLRFTPSSIGIYETALYLAAVPYGIQVPDLLLCAVTFRASLILGSLTTLPAALLFLIPSARRVDFLAKKSFT